MKVNYISITAVGRVNTGEGFVDNHSPPKVGAHHLANDLRNKNELRIIIG